MINVKKENGTLYISIIGKVDSTNAPTLEKEIWESVDFNNNPSIVIDAEELIMISSAGLRIILKMRKLCKDLKVIGANSDVYEVFDMTGFTEMMTVEKAYRKLSLDGCEVLGEGANGIVYRYDPEIVIKVYKNTNALEEIERERKLARRALVLGISTAIPFDIVKVGDTYGSVYELLNAKSFSKLIREEPENIDKYITLYVDLIKKIHSTEVDTNEMDSIKDVAIGWAKYLIDYLPKEQCDKLISLIEAVPERNTMIHGDYHTNNVQMQNGEVILIDMDTLSYGHPIFEFASMFLGFQGFGELDHSVTLEFMKLPYETTTYIWKKCLELYLGTTDENKMKEVEDKAKVIGYARLLRRTIKRDGFNRPDGKKIIENCKNKLAELLPRIDTLDFSVDEAKENKFVKEITLTADIENISVVTNFVDEQLEQLNCPLKAQTQIDIAIDELFGNIAHYAYNPDVGKATVRVEVEDNPLAVIITFMDNGVPYDPLKKADPDVTLSADERDIGGLGIFLVKKSMDDISYEYKDGQNILKIKKNI